MNSYKTIYFKISPKDKMREGKNMQDKFKNYFKKLKTKLMRQYINLRTVNSTQKC